MNRLRRLEDRHRHLVKEIAELNRQARDLMVNVPDGRAGSAAALAALYSTLVDLLSDELKLDAELSLGEEFIGRIKSEREYALTNAEFWKGSALQHQEYEAGLLEPVS